MSSNVANVVNDLSGLPSGSVTLLLMYICSLS